MSATLDVEPLLSLFQPAPRIMQLEGRQYPVTIHHLLRTPLDLAGALDAAVGAVRKIVESLPRGCILVFVPGNREIQWLISELQRALERVHDVVDLLPLYAGQSQEAQQLPFNEARENAWKIVVATNVAECSLTIPDARYVVDTGYARSQLHDGVFVTQPCSQASANQRTGRAGRTREGHCYRMYSSAFYVHHMEPHDVPHALRVPPEELLMQLLALGVGRPVTFPLPSAPAGMASSLAVIVLLSLFCFS
jgi:HrpA-like RNA helicase